MFRFFDAANAISLLGLASAVAGILLAAHGRLAYAIAALIGSGLCDFLDGAAARALTRDDQQRRFGGNLDSAVDACCFGAAPTMLLYAAGLQSPVEIAVLIAFAAAAVWRLAYFDTVGFETTDTDDGGRYYTGLPTTFVALVLPFALAAGFVGRNAMHVCAVVAAVGLTAAMVSTAKIPKPGGVWYIILTVAALALGGTFIALADQFPR